MDSAQKVVFPVEAVRAAYLAGEFSQDELAARAGRSKSAVSRLLSGGASMGEDAARVYYEAMLAIRAEKAGGA